MHVNVNVAHVGAFAVRFGRMTRRWEEHSKRIIVDQLQKMGAKLEVKEAAVSVLYSYA